MRMLERHADSVTKWFGIPASEIVPVDVTPVAQWYFDIDIVDRLRHKEQDFPNVAPPWPVTWWEFNLPAFVRENGRVNAIKSQGHRLAVLMMSVPVEEQPLDQFINSDLAWQAVSYYCEPFLGAQFPRPPHRHEALKQHLRELPGWVVVGFVMAEDRGRISYPYMCLSYLILRNGSLGPAETCTFSPLISDYKWTEEEIRLEAMLTAVPLFAASLLHCKNVEVLDQPVPPKVAAKRARNGKPPGHTYKTLVIDPMRKQVRSERQPGETEIQRALHICRGHFRTYTENKPLFGRVTGTFWIPMHARGSEKNGRVEKDYRIKAPRA